MTAAHRTRLRVPVHFETLKLTHMSRKKPDSQAVPEPLERWSGYDDLICEALEVIKEDEKQTEPDQLGEDLDLVQSLLGGFLRGKNK